MSTNFHPMIDGQIEKTNQTMEDRLRVCAIISQGSWEDQLDSCFLKGPYGGQRLAVVGRDGNNHMLPLAWAIVDVGNEDS